MKKNVILLLCFAVPMLLTLKGFCQKLTEKQILGLESTMNAFIAKQEKPPSLDTIPVRRWEYMTCFLTIDSSGNVSSFGVLSADETKGATYNYLFKMKVQDFGKTNLESCKDKTVVIPFISAGLGNWPEYMDSVMKERPVSRAGIVNIVDNIVWTTPFVYDRAILHL
jgi:hypothetical protein